MQKKFINNLLPSLKRVKQQNNSYCGPAVLEMLYSFLGKEFTQDQIVKASGVGRRIKTHGMLVADMAQAVKKLTPECVFWFKRLSKESELSEIINSYHYPVGVEWQGVFDYDGKKDDDDDDDPGHYSVVTGINLKDRTVFLSDPFRFYAGKDRQFTLLRFERRWWDINEVINPKTGKIKEMDDYHMMFMIVPKENDFPLKFRMKNS